MRKDITKPAQSALSDLVSKGGWKESIRQLFQRAILSANTSFRNDPCLLWTEEEHLYQNVINAIRNEVDWRGESFVHRFVFEDLGQFVKLHSVYLRASSLSFGYSTQFVEIWSLLGAIGLDDSRLMQYLASHLPYPANGVSKDLNAMFNCVVSIARGNDDYVSLFPLTPRTKLVGWLRGLYDALAGIANNNPKLVSIGIEAFLKGYRRAFYLEPLDGLLALPAHGLARMAANRGVSLSGFFDFHRSLPWDAELYEWLQNNKIDLNGHDLGDIPGYIADLFLRCEPPDWWSRVYETPEEARKAESQATAERDNSKASK